MMQKVHLIPLVNVKDLDQVLVHIFLFSWMVDDATRGSSDIRG